MELYIIITAFSFVTILLCFGFCFYVINLVLGGFKKEVSNIEQEFTPISEAPSTKLSEYMDNYAGSFTEGKTLDLNRPESIDTSPLPDMSTDPGENSVM